MSYIKIGISTEMITDFLKEHNIQRSPENVNAVERHLAALALAWAKAEMQDAKKEDVLEWIEWAKDDQPETT